MTSPLKYHGGKSYLAGRIVALFPPRKSEEHPDGYVHYVETFAGGLSVMLAQDPEGISEVANDVNGSLSLFWRVLADPDLFRRFQRIVEGIPFSEAAWHEAGEALRLEDDPTSAYDSSEYVAAAFFVRCRQSMAGRMRDFATLSRNRVRRGMNEQASAWLSAVEGLPEVHARLKRVVILNRPALEVIRQQDGPGTLFYLDPPYLHETRTAKDVYAHEMTTAQHRDLLVTLGGKDVARAVKGWDAKVPDWYADAEPIRGKFVLSGYPHPLYACAAQVCGWHRVDIEVPNHAAGGAEKRRMVECCWMNFTPAREG